MSLPSGRSASPRRKLATSLLLAAAAIATSVARAQNVQFLPDVYVVAGATASTGATAYSGDGTAATAATFPGVLLAATMDSYGNTFLTDSTGKAIRRVDAITGIITTYAGLANGKTVCTTAAPGAPANAVPDSIGNNCLATQATLNAPNGLRFYKGDLYIADATDNEVRVVNGVTGVITIYAGNGVKALTVANGTSTATAVSIAAPSDIAFDSAGNGYILTGGGFPMLVKVAAGTGVVSIVAGNGTAATTGDGGPATAAEIQTPLGVAVDSQGNIFFSQTATDTIRKVIASTGTIITYAGTGVTGFSGDGGPSNAGALATPQRIVVDASGNLYIADQINHRIRIVTPPAAGATYGTLGTYLGSGTPSDSASGTILTNALLNNPRSIDITPSGDFIIADGFNRQIKLVAPPANFSGTVAQNAVGTALGSTTTFNAAARVTTALTVASYGVPSAYKSFTNGVAAACPANTAVAAGTICNETLSFTPVKAGLQGAPLELIDSSNNIYTLPVAGIGNAPAATILPGIVSAIAGTGATGNTGNNAAAISATLNKPSALAFDALGNYYFADTANNEVREVNASTGIISVVAGTGAASFSGDGAAATAATLNAPTGLVVDGAGNLYIADTGNSRIRFVSASTGLITTFAGTGTASYTGDGGLATAATLNAPQGLYLTPSGILYIADTGNNVIRTVGLRSGAITTLSGTGTAGYAGDTGESASAQFTTPTAVTVDNTGDIYIADKGNNVIRRITNGVITTYAGSKSAGFTDGATTSALFKSPSALAVDASGTLYVADTGNNAIRRIAAGQVLTVAGSTTSGFTGNGGSSTVATFSAPQGVGLDYNGNLIIADTANNAIRSVAVTSAKLAFPTISPNTTSTPLSVSLTNSGNQTLTVSGTTIPANFAEQPNGGVNPDCNATGLTLAPAASCLVSIVFTPTGTVTYMGTSTVADNTQNIGAAAQTIALTGTGAYVFTAAITAPSPITAGASETVTVSITNPAATYTGTIAFTSSDPNATLPANYTFTAANKGTQTFTVVFKTAGTQTITVTDTSNSTITSSAIVTVTGGAPASLVIVTGNNQTASINSAYTLPLTVEALDSLGNPSPNATVTFTGPTTNADISFTGTTPPNIYTGITNSHGLLTTPFLTSDGVTGTFAITAAAAGITPVAFTLTNTSTVAANFTLASNPASINSLAPGTSSTLTVTITPVGGFNAPVNVTCAINSPLTSCTASPATIPASGNGTPTSFTVTVSTTGPATTSALRNTHVPLYACFLLLTLSGAFRKRKHLRALAVLTVCALALSSLTGCGGANLHANQTAPGTYALTITATSGSITNTLVVPYYVAGAP